MRKIVSVVSKVAAAALLCAVVVVGSKVEAKASISQDMVFANSQNQSTVALYNNYYANAQYQAALYAQQQFARQQNAAVNQAYLIQQMQFLQYQQYQSMIRAQNLDYQNMLLDQYRLNQVQAQNAYCGWNGVYGAYGLNTAAPVVVIP